MEGLYHYHQKLFYDNLCGEKTVFSSCATFDEFLQQRKLHYKLNLKNREQLPKRILYTCQTFDDYLTQQKNKYKSTLAKKPNQYKRRMYGYIFCENCDVYINKFRYKIHKHSLKCINNKSIKQ